MRTCWISGRHLGLGNRKSLPQFARTKMAAETIGWIYPLPTKDACFAGYPVTMPITYLFSTPRGFTLWMDLIRDVNNFGPDSLPKLRHCDVTNQYRPDARFAFPAVAGAPWLVCKWTAYVNAGNWSGVPKGILTPPPPPPPALDKITGGGGRLGLEEWGWGWSVGWTWHVGTQNCVESLSTKMLYAYHTYHSQGARGRVKANVCVHYA